MPSACVVLYKSIIQAMHQQQLDLPTDKLGVSLATGEGNTIKTLYIHAVQ